MSAWVIKKWAEKYGFTTFSISELLPDCPAIPFHIKIKGFYAKVRGKSKKYKPKPVRECSTLAVIQPSFAMSRAPPAL